MSSAGIKADQIRMRPVKWLWPGRIPRGMLTGFDGDPERGKSQHLVMMAAHVTTGTDWPDGTACPKGGVILIGAEDSWEATVKPRLVAAGADCSMVRLLSNVPCEDGSQRLLSIPEDIDFLELLVREDHALLIGFDPLSAYLSDSVNANSEAEVRRALTPMAEMLDRTDCSSIALRHLAKNDKVGNALYRGLGSIAFNAIARSVLALSKDPELLNTYIFSVIKMNIFAKPRPRRYQIEPVALEDGRIQTSRIVWKEETDHTAEELLTAFGKGRPRKDAGEFLSELLADGPVDSKLVFEGADELSISGATLKRAKKELGIIATKSGFGQTGNWTWELPAGDHHRLKGITTALRGSPPKGITSTDSEGPIEIKTAKGLTQSFDPLSTSNHKGDHNGQSEHLIEDDRCPACGKVDYTPRSRGRRQCRCGHVWTPQLQEVV